MQYFVMEATRERRIHPVERLQQPPRASRAMHRHLGFLALCIVLAVPATASAPSPYAGLADRPIRALSEAQRDDLLAGRGMGLALAAELNGWPGPAHVLELSPRLGLTPPQHEATATLFARMQAEAQALGRAIVAEEHALDQAFRTRRIDADRLEASARRLGVLHGALRNVHLRAHLDQASILSTEQIAAYGRLRGYGGHGPAHGGARHH